MKPFRSGLLATVFTVGCAISADAANIFVDLGSTTSSTSSTINSPLAAGTGTWAYSAAAQVPGTTWNTLPSVAAAALTAGQAGNPNISSTPSTDYNLYSSPRSLVDSLGVATTVNINMISHYAGSAIVGSTRESIQYVNNTGATPTPLMSNSWRDQNNQATGPSTTWEFVLSGLLVDQAYAFYFYGSGNAANQGITGTLGAGNGGATASTSGIPTTTTIYNGDLSGVTDQGVGWNVLTGVSDGSGNLSFTASRGPSGQFFLNGFQIVQIPEPSSAALLGFGALFAFRRSRKS